MTISIGVAASTEQSTVDGILDAADAALYRAKVDGRNRVVYAMAECCPRFLLTHAL